MNFKNWSKITIYLIILGGLLYYLYTNDLLKWIVAVISVLYLIFYFGIATLAIFSITISELGSIMTELSRVSPLLSIILLIPMIFLLWLVLLVFWPLFVIPDESLVRNPEKYDAIHSFETKVRAKYYKF
jgi:hypothetical protein